MSKNKIRFKLKPSILETGEMADEERYAFVALLWVYAKYISFTAVALGRGTKAPFKMRELFDASKDAAFALHGLDRESVDRVREASIQAVTGTMMGFFPDPDIASEKYTSDERARAQVAMNLSAISPSFFGLDLEEGEHSQVPSLISDALRALNAGEVSGIFAPSKRRGKERGSFTINKLRLEISLLSRSIKCERSFDRDKLVYDAVKQGWDTVSRWKKKASLNLDSATVRGIEKQTSLFLERSKNGLNEAIVARIKVLSEAYWSERRKHQ